MKTPRIINIISALQRRGVDLDEYDELDQEFFIAFEQHMLTKEFITTKMSLAVSCNEEQLAKFEAALLPFYQPDAEDRQKKELARISAKAKSYMDKEYVVMRGPGHAVLTVRDKLKL